MDDLINDLVSFEVTFTPNNVAAPHPRFTQYKIKKKIPSQEERRHRMLELQKQRRYDYLSHIRFLANGECQDDTSENEMEMKSEEVTEEMEWSVQPRKPPRSYKNQLMLSEWLVDIPEDLESKWYFILCPEGKRSFVVAAKGSTCAYTKSGFCVNRFPSLLPGGNKHQEMWEKDCTILDCIYSETKRTYYVLDIMCWRRHPVFDSETEFRFHWLSAKLAEEPGLDEHCSLNPFRFIALPHFHYSVEEMQRVMASPLPFNVPLDGLLFYDKRTHYTHGTTPLVGWLKAYMLPEILGVQIPQHYFDQRPTKYVNLPQHIKTAKKIKRSKNSRRKKNSSEKSEAMITEPSQNPKERMVKE